MLFQCPNCENELYYNSGEQQVICSTCWKVIFTPDSPRDDLDDMMLDMNCCQWRTITDKQGKSLKLTPFSFDAVKLPVPAPKYKKEFMTVFANIVCDVMQIPPSFKQFLISYRYMDNPDGSAVISYQLFVPSFIGGQLLSGILLPDRHANRVIRVRAYIEGLPYAITE